MTNNNKPVAPAAATITADNNKLPTIKELDARLGKLESIILGDEK